MILPRDELPLRRRQAAAVLKPSDLLPVEVYHELRAEDPEDDPTCPVQYVYFCLDPQATRTLGDPRAPALLGIEYCGITQRVALSAETRDELTRELAFSRP